ncbi:uncharacterized protein LOC121997264 [Zingiber officinale]|uniref:Uncharacterized protein n=1 Tax=Zingiber officinale TaxID=94328 RepID=A0A8J5G972_ZINOF|nr:uncharacterized protein LOC121997264 [Zingiber officinale]KAG6500699.1 hypothetical protein ZIOFF_040549 [Zingiber officinale]
MLSPQKDSEPRSDGGGSGGAGGDAEWLGTLSEIELDFLISLKELVIRRATTIGHKHLADKFDVKMLRGLGIAMLEYAKNHTESVQSPSLNKTLALFYGHGSARSSDHEPGTSNGGLQTPSNVTPRRKRMWEGLCENAAPRFSKRRCL